MRKKPKGLRSKDRTLSYRINLPNTNYNNWFDRFIRVRDDLEIMEILLREFHIKAALDIARSMVKDLTYIVDQGVKRDE